MRSAVVLLAVLLAMSLSGCSGGDDGSSDSTLTTTRSTTATTTAAAPPPPPPITFTNTTVTGVASVGGGGTTFLSALFDIATLPANSSGAVVEARLTAGLDNPLERVTLAAIVIDPTTMAGTPVAVGDAPDARGVIRMVLTPELWAQDLTGIIGASTEGGVLVQWSAEIHVAHFIDRPVDDAYTSFPP